MKHTVEEIAAWGKVLDSKRTGLYANQGHICPLCGEDSGEGPIRLNFTKAPDGSMKDYFFHDHCASQLINGDDTFLSGFASTQHAEEEPEPVETECHYCDNTADRRLVWLKDKQGKPARIEVLWCGCDLQVALQRIYPRPHHVREGVDYEVTSLEEVGPEEEDGPWAEGWSARAAAITLSIPYAPIGAARVKDLQKHVRLVGRWKTVLWGTYGPEGTCSLKKKPLSDLETDHLEAILITQPQIEPWLKATILELLKIRYFEDITKPTTV